MRSGPYSLIAAWMRKTWMRKAMHAQRTRAALSALSDRELIDIGLHRGDIAAVTRGTFTR